MTDNNKDNKQLSWNNPAPGSSAPAGQPKETKPAVLGTPVGATGTTTRTAKTVGWLAVGVVAGVVIAWGATTALRGGTNAGSTLAGENAGSTSSTSTQAAATSSLVTVASPQKAGDTVAVGGINVAAPTWVVVYESRGGTPGNVLGAALFFPGTESGSVSLLRNTTAGQTYFVTERKDNGDHQYSSAKDALVLGADGQPSWATFTAN